MADCFAVTLSIEKPTADHILELDRIRTEVNILKYDQELEKEIQQLGVLLVFINQGSSRLSGQGEGFLNRFLRCFNKVELALSGAHHQSEQLSAKLQELTVTSKALSILIFALSFAGVINRTYSWLQDHPLGHVIWFTRC